MVQRTKTQTSLFAAWRHLGDMLERWSDVINLLTSSGTEFLIAILYRIKEWIHGTKRDRSGLVHVVSSWQSNPGNNDVKMTV